jgi:DNA-3-methyladenine glycosylase II
MLDNKRLHQGVRYLIEKDEDLRFIIDRHGFPPLWNRSPGFLSLLRIILEQQVSLASAKATYDKLLNEVNPMNPKTFLDIDNNKLKKVGFSRQKIRYCRELSKSLLNGRARDTVAFLS